jgi:hypothetical protein
VDEAVDEGEVEVGEFEEAAPELLGAGLLEIEWLI